jgi:hypothetical protein
MTDEGLVQSVRARLLNESRRTRSDPNVVLARYGLERFLHRLSESPHRDRFILKGAMMMVVWIGASTRATRDADLLGLGAMSAEELRTIFGDVCTQSVDDDGMSYDETSITIETIRAADPDGGRRVRLAGSLGRARVHVQIDVGLGDAVSPPPEWVDYPTLLAGASAPRLRAYRPETTIAEKLQAMIERGEANSRMKDFFDVAELARIRQFDGPVLAEAVQATFRKRSTEIPGGDVVPFGDSFAHLPDKQAQWKAFARRTGLDAAKMDFELAVRRVRAFLAPVLDSIASGKAFERDWPPGGPWKPRARRRTRS